MIAGSFNISEIKPVYAASPAASYAGEIQHHIYGGSEVIELKRYRVPNAEEKKVIDWLKEEVDEETIERVWKLKSLIRILMWKPLAKNATQSRVICIISLIPKNE